MSANPRMHRHDLCDGSHFKTIVVPVEAVRENPSFPVNESSEAYKTIAECEKLVSDTLAHIAQTHPFKRVVPLTVKWNPSLRAVLGHAAAWFGDEGSLDTLANLSRIEISLCPRSFYYDTPAGRANTIIHEACHAANFMLDEPTIESHGPEWKALMNLCGLPITKYSEYETPAVLCWRGNCPKCGQQWLLQNKRMLDNVLEHYTVIICNKCGNRMGALEARNAEPPNKFADWRKYMK